MIAFLRAQVDRGNDGSFSFCSIIFAISIRNFQKILKICLQTKIEDRNLRAGNLDILHFTTYLVLSHRDKKDAYKIKISKIEKNSAIIFRS